MAWNRRPARVLGVLMRRWQMTTAFEGELGLHIPGASASWAMIAFFFLAGAVLLLLAHNAPARQQPEGRVSRWDVLFAAEGDGVYLVLMILAALLTLAAAPLLFQEAARFMAIRKATGEGDKRTAPDSAGLVHHPGLCGNGGQCPQRLPDAWPGPGERGVAVASPAGLCVVAGELPGERLGSGAVGLCPAAVGSGDWGCCSA